MSISKIIATALLALALTGCAGKIGTSPQGLEIPIEKAAIKLGTDVKDGGYKLVATDELKKWLDEGKPLIMLSALPGEEDRAFGTLPGAVNAVLPKTEKDLTPADTERLLKAAGSDKGKTVVIYCGFVACRRSHLGAKLLVENGYSNVYRYPAGIAGWEQAGYPLVRQP